MSTRYTAFSRAVESFFCHFVFFLARFSQPRFCVLFSLGVAGMCLSNLALVGQNTGGSCVARVTVWGVGESLHSSP